MSAKPRVVRASKKLLPTQPTTKEEWLEQKLKNPSKYGMTATGDLESYDGGITIELIPKVPASVEYITEKFAVRQRELEGAQMAYTQAKRVLYELIQGYNSSGKNTTDSSLIMIANQKVRDAECLLSALTKEPRSAVQLRDLIGRDLQIEDNYDTTKIADPVISGVYTSFHWENFWMDKPVEKIPELVPEEQAPLEGGGDQPKREKTDEEKAKARKWAIINARRRNSSFK